MWSYEEILLRMQERYRLLAGFDADGASDIGIRLKVLAQTVHGLAEEMEALRGEVFPQTSTGQCLELHAETRGITRKEALPAQGVLRFSRELAGLGDTLIAKGVLCATRPDPHLQFETLEEAVLPAGELAVEVPARAVDPGAAGNVAAGAVCLMVTPAPGISTVSNPVGFSGGVDRESDEALRDRLLRSFRSISNGTNPAFYYDLAMSRGEVASAAVLSRRRGRGTVDVVISCHDPAQEAAVVADLQQELHRCKEINVDVLVLAAERLVTPLRIQAALEDGSDGAAVLQLCRERAEQFVQALPVGAPLLLARLGSALLEVEGVYNCRVLQPAGDVTPLEHQVLVPGEVVAERF